MIKDEQQLELEQDELFECKLSPGLLDHIDVSDMDKSAWPAIVSELHSLIEHKLNTTSGDVNSLDMTLAITDYLGGMQVYIPKADHVRKQLRNIEIYQKFNGKNVHQLTKEYNLAEQHIYRILAKMRKQETAKRQPSLF